MILAMALSIKTYSQTPIASWTTNAEVGVKNYAIEKSIDKTVWTLVDTVRATKISSGNSYSYPLSEVNVWYRIRANMEGANTLYTDPVFAQPNTNSAIISHADFKVFMLWDKLSFDVKNEVNVDYYLIEKNTGSGYIQQAKISATGKLNYTISFFRISRKPLYRVSAIFKDGTKSAYIMFS